MVIAMDGPAGSGKSSIARLLSQKLKITYINSGNLYRAFVHGALKKRIDTSDERAFFEYAQKTHIEFKGDAVFLDGADISPHLHSVEVDALVGQASANVELRRLVNSLIQKEAASQSIIVEGRDMTTVAFPNAEFRYYIDADVRTRTLRRFKQGLSPQTLEEIESGILRRDAIDRKKPEGALRIGEGVFYIDTSCLTLEEVCDIIIKEVLKTR